jgi:hypothetical protein
MEELVASKTGHEPEGEEGEPIDTATLQQDELDHGLYFGDDESDMIDDDIDLRFKLSASVL